MANAPVQPRPPSSGQPPLKIGAEKPQKANRRLVWQFLAWAVAFGALVSLALAAGVFLGFRSASHSQQAATTLNVKSSIEEQYALAVQNLAEGQYEVAHQRLEYVIAHDPSFPGATDRLAEVMTILYSTATPTALPPTALPTATRDLRPVEEMFAHAQALFAEQSWTEALDTLTTLRKEDLAYNTARVDGMMFIALRMRGFNKNWQSGDLNGGIYDLALASRFGPLDAQAVSARDLARLYLVGSSFWEVDPAQAVQYFSQVAAAAPGLRDASGITASARYREALIQYGDRLAASRDWCNALQQYELAYSLGPDEALKAKGLNAAEACHPSTATPAPTSEVPTEPPPSETLPPAVTPSPTSVIPPTNTAPPPPATNTPAPPATNTPPPPVNTPEPPTNTPEPPLTDTAPPPAPTDTQPAPSISTIAPQESPVS